MVYISILNLCDFTTFHLRDPAGPCVFRDFFRCQAQLFVPDGDSAAVRRLRHATASEAEISGHWVDAKGSIGKGYEGLMVETWNDSGDLAAF